ncbi:hypothetical protein Tco_1084981 [Tanacetum coccineum]
MATSSTEVEYVAAANCCGQVLKIHTDENVADLLTKAFDGPRKRHYTDDTYSFWLVECLSIDKSSKYFTHLREILHLLDRQDLSKLYGMVVKHYEANPIAGAGMMLWGDLHVLFESVEGGSSVEVWADQKDWVVSSWRLFPFSGVHVLETFSGTVLYMFADTPYPLSASTMKKMLKHKLEVEINGIGNDMTHAEQLIAFIKNRLAACLPSA